MANVLLIESRGEVSGASFCNELALQLARSGAEVTVLLVQNGVLPARAGAQSRSPAVLAAAGVSVLADAFSLRERGIDPAQLAPGVQVCELDAVIDRMVDGWKLVWH